MDFSPISPRFYQNEPKFNGIYSRKNLPKIKDEAYVVNLDEYKSIGTHWIGLHVNGNNNASDSYDTTYFDSFGVEYVPEEIKKFVGNKKIIKYIYRIQAYVLIMFGHFCIGFIYFMLKGKSLLDYTISFSANKYENNDK